MSRSVRFQPYAPLGDWHSILLKGHGVSNGALRMNTREYLLKAQQADAVAYTVESSRERCRWEEVAAEYRRLAKTVAVIRQDSDKDLHRLA